MIVVDSAAVVDALTVVAGGEELRAELSAEELHAPTLLDFEIVSALQGLTLGGQLGAARAQDALTDFDDLPIQRWPSDAALRLRAFSLRDNLTAYDAASGYSCDRTEHKMSQPTERETPRLVLGCALSA